MESEDLFDLVISDPIQDLFKGGKNKKNLWKIFEDFKANLPSTIVDVEVDDEKVRCKFFYRGFYIEMQFDEILIKIENNTIFNLVGLETSSYAFEPHFFAELKNRIDDIINGYYQ